MGLSKHTGPYQRWEKAEELVRSASTDCKGRRRKQLAKESMDSRRRKDEKTDSSMKSPERGQPCPRVHFKPKTPSRLGTSQPRRLFACCFA